MWKRIELHHHTIASDGKFTPEALAQYLHDHDRTLCKSMCRSAHGNNPGHGSDDMVWPSAGPGNQRLF